MYLDIPLRTEFPIIVPILRQTIFINNLKYLIVGIQPMPILFTVIHGRAESGHGIAVGLYLFSHIENPDVLFGLSP